MEISPEDAGQDTSVPPLALEDAKRVDRVALTPGESAQDCQIAMAVACDGHESIDGGIERFRWKGRSVQTNAQGQVIRVHGQFDDAGDEVVIEAHEVIAGNHQQPVVRLVGQPLVKPCGKSVDLGGEPVMPGGSQLLAALTNPTIERRGDIGGEVRIVRGRGNRHTACRLRAVKVGIDGEGGPSQVTDQPSDGKLRQRARLVPSCHDLGRGNDRPDSSERIEKGPSYRFHFGSRLQRLLQTCIRLYLLCVSRCVPRRPDALERRLRL